MRPLPLLRSSCGTRAGRHHEAAARRSFSECVYFVVVVPEPVDVPVEVPVDVPVEVPVDVPVAAVELPVDEVAGAVDADVLVAFGFL